MNQVITLTTDFGTQDGFTAQMKGVILGINPDATIIDVTHDIRPFSILEAALVIKGVSRYFPSGTIHVAVVDPGVGSLRRGIVLKSGAQSYVGPDNGLFSFVIADKQDWEIREISNPDLILPHPHPTFHGRDVFAPVTAHLSAGVPFHRVGSLVLDPLILEIPKPINIQGGLQGEVIYVDRFGNLSCNLEAKDLKRDVAAVELGATRIAGISTYFGQVSEGSPLALINSFGLLEIAVNRGNASETLGVSGGHPIRVLWA